MSENIAIAGSYQISGVGKTTAACKRNNVTEGAGYASSRQGKSDANIKARHDWGRQGPRIHMISYVRATKAT